MNKVKMFHEYSSTVEFIIDKFIKEGGYNLVSASIIADLDNYDKCKVLVVYKIVPKYREIKK